MSKSFLKAINLEPNTGKDHITHPSHCYNCLTCEKVPAPLPHLQHNFPLNSFLHRKYNSLRIISHCVTKIIIRNM